MIKYKTNLKKSYWRFSIYVMLLPFELLWKHLQRYLYIKYFILFICLYLRYGYGRIGTRNIQFF